MIFSSSLYIVAACVSGCLNCSGHGLVAWSCLGSIHWLLPWKLILMWQFLHVHAHAHAHAHAHTQREGERERETQTERASTSSLQQQTPSQANFWIRSGVPGTTPSPKPSCALHVCLSFPSACVYYCVFLQSGPNSYSCFVGNLPSVCPPPTELR